MRKEPAKVLGQDQRVAQTAYALETAGSAGAVNDDAARFLPVFRAIPLQTEARRDPARSRTAMGPYPETTESAASPVLVLSEEPALVRTTLCGLDTPPDGLTALSPVQPGEPVAGNLLDGFCEGGQIQEALLKVCPYPPQCAAFAAARESGTAGPRHIGDETPEDDPEVDGEERSPARRSDFTSSQ